MHRNLECQVHESRQIGSEKGGFLGLASCSHHVSPEAFLTECSRGISESGRNGRIVKIAGAAPDHPVHPLLPETGYLKMIFFQLD